MTIGSRSRASNVANWSTLGARAAAAWVQEVSHAEPRSRWSVEIAMDVGDVPPSPEFDERTASRFHFDIYSEEWGFLFCHAGQLSRIRVTDVPFIHGRDDHRLLDTTPALADVGALLRRLERQHRLAFRRDLALVRSDLPNVEPSVRRWLLAL